MEKLYVTRSSMPTYEEFIDEIRTFWDTHWLTNMGPKHNELQQLLVNYLGVNRLELVTNGHMALELAIEALELKGEVITTPFTFASTTHAIVRNGLKPVFCDINPNDYTIDVEKIESLITDRTCAILPVHVYGNICNIEEIEIISKKHGIKVIYDAAHAFGEQYHGKGIGTFGDATCFSFHATKVFNTIEGGAICSSDREMLSKISNLKNFGIINEDSVEAVGTNAKLNEFCAAMGICNLRHIDSEITKRKQVVDYYRKRLEGIRGIRLNPIQDHVNSNYSYFPILIDENQFGRSRDDVYDGLVKNHIYSRKYFFPLTSEFDCYKNKYGVSETPVASMISSRVLTLPLYADLTYDAIETICDLIIESRE